MASEHVQKYLDRIEMQHAGQPRFMAHCEALLELADGAYQALRSAPDRFDVHTAVGRQLDVLGERAGISRRLNAPGSLFSGKDLDDESYRMLIYAKIFMNHWDGTAEMFQSIWDSTLGRLVSAVYTDNQDMTVNIDITGRVTPVILELILAGKLLPRPMGVGVNITVSGVDVDDDTERETLSLISAPLYNVLHIEAEAI